MPTEGAVWAVVPLKSFALAKRRLVAVLDADERAHLAAAMAADVLSMLRSVRGVAGTAVVTPDRVV
ncbi:MAG: 2-phospho-L-lactate guanylyltransferase, partial [Alphaproteobacteria bacterium]